MSEPSRSVRSNRPSEIVLPDRVVKALEAIAARLESDQSSAPLPTPQIRLTHSLFTELRFGLGSVAFNTEATQLVTSRLVDNEICYAANSLPLETKSLSVIYPAPKAATNEDVNPSIEHHVHIDSQVDPLAVMFFDKTSGDKSKAAILVSFVTR